MTGAELRAAAFTTEYHVRYQNGGYVFSYLNRAEPRVRMRIERPWPTAPREVTLLVGERAFAGDQWDEAAAALAALDGGTDAAN